MDRKADTEQLSKPDKPNAIKTHELISNIEGNQRRQDKVVAAIVRRNPRLILQNSVSLTNDERTEFKDRCDDSRLDRIRNSDYEAALAETPTSIIEPRSEENLQRVWESFKGDEADKRRMRRVVAFVTKGSIKEQAAVQPDDLYTLVKQKCRNAVAFEHKIPEILDLVDDPEGYKPILNEVGLTLFGSQWVYLQQGRLAESAARGEVTRDKAEVSNRTTDADEISKAVAKIEFLLSASRDLNTRLERFNVHEKVRLPSVPKPKYRAESLARSEKKRHIGNFVVCEDKTLDREGLGNVLAGYDKNNHLYAFKVSERPLGDADDPGIINEEYIKDRSDNPVFFTYESKMVDGEKILRAYPLISTDLHGYIDRNGPLDSKAALGMMIQVGQGLRELHSMDRAHTDVAGTNIFIDHEGQAYLADFDALLSSSELHTYPWLAAGNVYIKPPEVYEDAPHSIEAIDTYEATVLLYQSLVGTTPYHHLGRISGESIEDRRQRYYRAKKEQQYTIPDNIPNSIKAIISKGLQPDPTKRYQNMDEMLTDLLNAYDTQEETQSDVKVFRQPELTQTPEISPRLATNQDAHLEAAIEMQDYFARQDQEYLDQLKALNTEIGAPMHKDTKAAVCIPLAGAQETATIYKTLSGYAEQSAAANDFEVVLLVNTPARFAETKQADVQATLAEIERAKADFPNLNVRVANIVIPDDQVNIWNIRKITTDLAVLRATETQKTDNILLLSNDADNQGISNDYIKAYIDYFAAHPEKDGAVGNLQYDPEAFIRFPEMAVSTEFTTLLDQRGYQNGNVTLVGANSVMKANIYTAIGGYPTEKVSGVGGEQGWTGKTIRNLRKQKTLGFVDGALLTTSSRRGVLRYLEDSSRKVRFGDEETEARMRALDISTLSIFDWDNVDAAAEMQRLINERLNTVINKYDRGESLGKDSWFYRTNLEAIGIKYRIEGNPKDPDSSIVITDMRSFVDRQKRMRSAIESGETNMAKVFEAVAA